MWLVVGTAAAVVVIRNGDLWWQWPQVARVKCGEGVERCRNVSSGEKGVDSGSATKADSKLSPTSVPARDLAKIAKIVSRSSVYTSFFDKLPALEEYVDRFLKLLG